MASPGWAVALLLQLLTPMTQWPNDIRSSGTLLVTVDGNYSAAAGYCCCDAKRRLPSAGEVAFVVDCPVVKLSNYADYLPSVTVSIVPQRPGYNRGQYTVGTVIGRKLV